VGCIPAGAATRESCFTKFALAAGLYRVSILTYATQADATTQINPLRVLTTDFALSSATTVVEIVNSPTVPDGEQVAASHCSTCCRLTTRSTLGCKLVESH